MYDRSSVSLALTAASATLGKPVNWRDHIAADPQVLAGKPVVRGTRLSVDLLLGLSAAGWTAGQVSKNYPSLTPDALRPVLPSPRNRFATTFSIPFDLTSLVRILADDDLRLV